MQKLKNLKSVRQNFLDLIRNRLGSSPKKQSLSASNDTSNTKQVYASCSELPLWNFIKIVITGDLTYLGDGTPEQLQEAWANIFMEYCDIFPSKNSIYVCQLTSEIEHLRTKLEVIQAIIDALSIQYIPDLVLELIDYGFNYPFTPETMLEDLQGVIAESKMFVVQKGVKEGEYKRFLESQKGDPAKESDYDEILSELSKFQGYHLKSKDLSVSEFVAIFNRYNKQAK